MSGSSSASPDSAVLTALQELVDAWTEEDYATAITNCNALLKKRKSLDSTVAASIQRLLLQCHLQQNDLAKVLEFCSSNNNEHKDLALYAQYRQEDYESVSQQASKESPLEQHLLAQSYFHLNQMNPALRVYQELLKSQDLDDEAKMELLTNAVAVLSSTCTAVVPYVATTASPQLLDQATAFAEEHPEYCDLALNVGTLQCLTDSGASGKKWLEKAKENCSDPEDMVPIDMNLVWSRHFWQNDDDNVQYNVTKGTAPQTSIAQLNQALLDHKPLVNLPHPKWNALQVGMYWYNRAVQQYQKQQFVECLESCQSLKKTVSGGAKKKKGGDSKPSSPAEWWWQSRIDVLFAHVQQQQSKVEVGTAKLEERLEGLRGQPTCDIMDHAIAYVQLHLQAIQHPNATKEEKLALLKRLPSSIQSMPAVQATLEVLGAAASTGSSKNTKKGSPLDQADALFEQGRYAEAAKLYQENLPAPSASSDAMQIACHLKRVQALAMSDQHAASTDLWEALGPFLDDAIDEPSDGGANIETLETKALPRTSSSSHHHNKAATPLAVAKADDAATPNNNKRSKESVLRQRARRREAHLKKLEEKGEYNPDRPTKPNAERWVPKHERSRARRRGQQQNNRSAQGGGSQADAQRLDAAARRAGTVPSTAGPSTANLKVSTGGRKGGRRR